MTSSGLDTSAVHMEHFTGGFLTTEPMAIAEQHFTAERTCMLCGCEIYFKIGMKKHEK